MVFQRKKAESKPKRPFDEMTVTFEAVELPPEKEDERVKRLSKQILACIERAKQERRRGKKCRSDDPFHLDFDAIFGLSTEPV